MERRISYTVTEEDQCPAVREVLIQKLNMTAKQISRAKFLPQGICLNGERCRITRKTESGDVVTVLLESGEKSEQMIPVEHSLSILYEDEDLLVIDKEAGVVVHPSPGHFTDTISNYVAAYLRKTGQEAVLRSIGRLDKDTSGCLVFAKNRFSAARLSMQREQGVFHKTYFALASGYFQKGDTFTIEQPIGKVPGSLMKMQVCEDGREALTTCYVLESCETASLLAVEITHGRTHQIRVHLSSIEHPLIGDRLYGTRLQDCRRTMLHALMVAFIHPVSGAEMKIKAPLPEEMRRVADGVVKNHPKWVL